MKVLFLTLVHFESLQERNLYTDLLREFIKNGHQVYVISPVEKRLNEKTHLIHEENAVILSLQIGNTQKTNVIRKGINTVLIEPLFKKAIMHYFSDVRFDLVLYSTPPITLVSAIEYVKKRDGARTYLMLKDIFPQNAVDIGMMSTEGIKGLLYRHFRRKEKKLYAISDRIGCMSPANVKYLIGHNPEVNPGIVEICPNCIDPVDKSVDGAAKELIRQKYEIPSDKKVFVYGGNLGKPQGIPFFTECIKSCRQLEEAFFLIVGNGTEYSSLEAFVRSSGQKNVKLMKGLPKEDYDTLVGACDVGMIFLDHRFTIPNFPSRLLSYMQAKLPVLACTDPNSDIGEMITSGRFGWWCESNDPKAFTQTVQAALSEPLTDKGIAAYDFLVRHYTAEKACQMILDRESQSGMEP